jgi:hypothetical protein
MNEEFACIRKVAQKFPYVSMDTEFPGVVAKPTGTFRNNSDYQCGTLFCVWLTVTLRQLASFSTAITHVLQIPVLEDERRHTARHSNRRHILRRRRQLPCRYTLHLAVPLLFQLAERHVRAAASPSPKPPPAAVTHTPLRPTTDTPRTPSSCCAPLVFPAMSKSRLQLPTVYALQASTSRATAAPASTFRTSGSC